LFSLSIPNEFLIVTCDYNTYTYTVEANTTVTLCARSVSQIVGGGRAIYAIITDECVCNDPNCVDCGSEATGYSPQGDPCICYQMNNNLPGPIGFQYDIEFLNCDGLIELLPYGSPIITRCVKTIYNDSYPLLQLISNGPCSNNICPTPTPTPTITPTQPCCGKPVITQLIKTSEGGAIDGYQINFNTNVSGCLQCAQVIIEISSDINFTNPTTVISNSCSFKPFQTNLQYFYVRVKSTCVNFSQPSPYSDIWGYFTAPTLRLWLWDNCISGQLYVLHTSVISNVTPSGTYGSYYSPNSVTSGPIQEIKTNTYWNPNGECSQFG
jgi:hypothetical protein